MKTKFHTLLALHLGLAAGVAQPVITNQPSWQTNIIGGTAMFSVGATGALPLFYQWRKSTAGLPGQTNSTLVLTNLQVSQQAIYSVVVSNAGGSVTSSDARLYVLTPPIITPPNPTASLFADVTLVGSNAPAGPVSYQWLFNGEPIAGAMTNKLVVTNVQKTNAGNYALVVTYAFGSATSQVAKLKIVPFSSIYCFGDCLTDTHTEETRRGIQAKVDQFNDALVRALGALDQSLPDLRIVIPDAGGLITRFIEHPQDYGMTVAFPAAAQDPALFDKSLTGPGADYVWWDEYGHPTTKGHGALADLFLAALRDARPESLNVSVAGAQVNIQMKKLLRGRDYTLQTSSDLASWHDVQTFTAAAGTNQVLHTVEAGTRSTFYHLQWQP